MMFATWLSLLCGVLKYSAFSSLKSSESSSLFKTVVRRLGGFLGLLKLAPALESSSKSVLGGASLSCVCPKLVICVPSCADGLLFLSGVEAPVSLYDESAIEPNPTSR